MTGWEWVRVAVTMLVITSGWRLWWLLQRDKLAIYPPYWVPIIRAFHVVIFATGVALVISIAANTTITWATWVMFTGYLVLLLVAILAPRRTR